MQQKKRTATKNFLELVLTDFLEVLSEFEVLSRSSGCSLQAAASRIKCSKYLKGPGEYWNLEQRIKHTSQRARLGSCCPGNFCIAQDLTSGCCRDPMGCHHRPSVSFLQVLKTAQVNPLKRADSFLSMHQACVLYLILQHCDQAGFPINIFIKVKGKKKKDK